MHDFPSSCVGFTYSNLVSQFDLHTQAPVQNGTSNDLPIHTTEFPLGNNLIKVVIIINNTVEWEDG